MAAGRRRTDVPQDALWGAGGPPLDPGGAPARGPSRPGAAPVGADQPVRIPRSRLPLPPVPAGAGALRAPGGAFDGLPTPELPGGPAGDGHRPERLPGDPVGVRAVLPRAARARPQQEHELVSTGPGLTASGRGAGPASRLPQPTPVAGAPSPAYGDWTKPSRSGAQQPEADLLAEPWAQAVAARPVAPATTAIPERSVSSGRRPAEDDVLPRQRDSRPASGEFPVHGASGPTTGSGRAAMRAQRQAIDMARRKAAKRAGEPVGVPADETPTRGPRRALMGLLAMVVVALAVLGVYTVVDPTEASDSTATAPTATAPTQTAVLPPLDTGELEVDVEAPAAAPATPVTAPVTVLNATDINGLAADVAGVIAAGGWETPGVGTYLADDVATSTVFYTAGDQAQQQAAESLQAQFPQLLTTAERFFEVPADVAAPGLVVVLTAPW